MNSFKLVTDLSNINELHAVVLASYIATLLTTDNGLFFGHEISLTWSHVNNILLKMKTSLLYPLSWHFSTFSAFNHNYIVHHCKVTCQLLKMFILFSMISTFWGGFSKKDLCPLIALLLCTVCCLSTQALSILTFVTWFYFGFFSLQAVGGEKILDYLSCTCMWVYMKSVRGQFCTKLLCLHGVFYFTLEFAGTPNTGFTYWWETGTSLSISDTHPTHTHSEPYLKRMC